VGTSRSSDPSRVGLRQLAVARSRAALKPYRPRARPTKVAAFRMLAARRAGLDGLRFHDLRHTAATLAAAAGATTKELMERMGHTSPAVALRYQHVMADRQAARMVARATAVPKAKMSGAWISLAAARAIPAAAMSRALVTCPISSRR
jgi:integrase